MSFFVINDDNLYSKTLSENFCFKSIKDLRKREEESNIDIKVSEYIRKNYMKEKLFNQFNHPKRVIFEFLTKSILERIGINNVVSLSSIGYLDGTSTPIYPSTLKNLELEFDEIGNDKLYFGIGGEIKQEDVVSKFYELYTTIDSEEIYNNIKKFKPFVIKLVDTYCINKKLELALLREY